VAKSPTERMIDAKLPATQYLPSLRQKKIS
jgi:hypothetical protein